MHWTKVQYTPPSKFLNCPPVLKVSVASRPSRHDTIAMNVKCPRNFPALSTILAALLLSAQGLHATDAPEVEADTDQADKLGLRALLHESASSRLDKQYPWMGDWDRSKCRDSRQRNGP